MESSTSSADAASAWRRALSHKFKTTLWCPNVAPSHVPYQPLENFYSPVGCSHDAEDEIDLSDSTGDIVCGNCGLVKDERFPTGGRKPTRPMTSPREQDSDLVEGGKLEQKLRNIFNDALCTLHLDNDEVVERAVLCAVSMAQYLKVDLKVVVEREKWRAHLAWALFCGLMRCEVYRSPLDIATLMGVTKKAFLAAENSLNKCGYPEGMHEALASERIGSICDHLRLSHQFRVMAEEVCREVEPRFYAHKRELFIYHLLMEMIGYLRPDHIDKKKVDIFTGHELRGLLQIQEASATNVLKLPYRTILRLMMERNAI